jgi:hypothetical protein
LLEASRKLKHVLFNVVWEEAPEIARPKHKEVEHGEDEDEEEARAKTASRQSVITTGKVSGRSELPPGAMETSEKDKDSSMRMGVEVKTQRSIYPAAFCCLFCFDDEEMTGAQKVKALLGAARESERPKPQHHNLHADGGAGNAKLRQERCQRLGQSDVICVIKNKHLHNICINCMQL